MGNARMPLRTENLSSLKKKLQTKFTKNPKQVVSYKVIPLFLSFNQKTKVIKDSKKAEYGQYSYATEN